MATNDRFEISTALPAPARIGLGVFGSFIVVMVIKDLWRGVRLLSVFSPFFLVILGGGLLVGLTLIVAMIWGPDERWIILPGRFTVIRSLRQFRSEKTLAAAVIGSIGVETVDWDSRPDTFRLRIALKTGKILRSPDFSTHGAAENARRLLLGI